jgi:hypothetical protein
MLGKDEELISSESLEENQGTRNSRVECLIHMEKQESCVWPAERVPLSPKEYKATGNTDISANTGVPGCPGCTGGAVQAKTTVTDLPSIPQDKETLTVWTTLFRKNFQDPRSAFSENAEGGATIAGHGVTSSQTDAMFFW